MHLIKQCHLYIVRHGATDWNAAGKIQGHTDIPLNAEGESQALSLKHKLQHIPFAAVFSSDLLRAKKTAEIIVGKSKIPFIATADLREKAMGIFEGQPFTAFRSLCYAHVPYLKTLSKEACLSFPYHETIETNAAVYARFQRFIEIHTATYENANLLVVSHGGFIEALLSHLDFAPGRFWHISNCAVLKVQAKNDQLDLIEYEGIFC